jgi:hypothetical protein
MKNGFLEGKEFYLSKAHTFLPTSGAWENMEMATNMGWRHRR